MPQLECVMESSLYVTDLRRAIAFYRDVLGLRVMSEFDGQRGAALAVGPTVLLLFRAEETLKDHGLPTHGATGTGHVAFRVQPEDIDTLIYAGVCREQFEPATACRVAAELGISRMTLYRKLHRYGIVKRS